MNKSELIQELENKYHKVFVSSKALDGDVIKRHEATVYDESSEALKRETILFYVENEGEASEVAYWDGREPKSGTPPVVTFNDEINNYIQTKIDAGVIEGAFVDNIDNVKEIAYAKTIINISGVLQEKKVFIDKDAGNLQHRVIG